MIKKKIILIVISTILLISVFSTICFANVESFDRITNNRYYNNNFAMCRTRLCYNKYLLVIAHTTNTSSDSSIMMRAGTYAQINYVNGESDWAYDDGVASQYYGSTTSQTYINVAASQVRNGYNVDFLFSEHHLYYDGVYITTMAG